MIYFWDVAADQSFNTILVSGSTTDTISTAFETLPSRTFYWRVYANDSWESSEHGNPPSGYWSFTTSDVPEDRPPAEFNYKPIIALIFAITLGLIGAFVALRRPLEFKNEPKRKLYTWLILVSPFVIAEALTGIVSGLTGILSILPLIGPGMLVDLGILIGGIIIFMFQILRKSRIPDVEGHSN